MPTTARCHATMPWYTKPPVETEYPNSMCLPLLADPKLADISNTTDGLKAAHSIA